MCGIRPDGLTASVHEARHLPTAVAGLDPAAGPACSKHE